MNEATKKGIEILVEGYPLTFLVTICFYVLIKLLALVKVREDAE